MISTGPIFMKAILQALQTLFILCLGFGSF